MILKHQLLFLECSLLLFFSGVLRCVFLFMATCNWSCALMERLAPNTTVRELDFCEVVPVVLHVSPPKRYIDRCVKTQVLTFGCRGQCRSYVKVSDEYPHHITHMCRWWSVFDVFLNGFHYLCWFDLRNHPKKIGFLLHQYSFTSTHLRSKYFM